MDTSRYLTLLPAASMPPQKATFMDDGAFPELPKDRLLTKSDLIAPRIIDTSPGKFDAPEGIDTDSFTGADGIVTILHRHDPKLLRDFLDTTRMRTFTWTWCRIGLIQHESTKQPFSICREGMKIKAGYRTGYKNEEPAAEWDSFCRFEILPTGEWQVEGAQSSTAICPRMKWIVIGHDRPTPTNTIIGTFLMKDAILARIWEC